MALREGTQMPSFEGATEWLNATGARAEAEAEGRPTLVHFWSVGCKACLSGLGRVARWRERWKAEGLRVVAVHTPHLPAETDAEAVREAVSLNDITQPCAVDNEHKLRDAFQIEEESLPAFCLFDAEGRLHAFESVEQGLDRMTDTLETLLGAPPPKTEEQA
jgi:thiol-disulfide isomerase/thioredoxin